MQAHLSLQHFRRLMGAYGLYQHADTNNPILSEGYCTDDNARAVQVLVRLIPFLAGAQRKDARLFLEKCWRFLKEAEQAPGSFINFREANGRWLPRKPESEDMYARVIRCLVELIIHDEDDGRRQEAAQKLEELEGRIKSLTAPRAIAETLVALAKLTAADKVPPCLAGWQDKGYQALAALWQKNVEQSWQWFEPVMTYANALFPHALVALTKEADKKIQDNILEASARFLIAATIRENMFIPIGSDGWYAKGGRPATNNQQPIEAGLMFDFLLEYRRYFPERVSVAEVAAPYLWFFGCNTGHVVLADTEAGASYDGLFDLGINDHRGAESMLAYLWTEILLARAPAEVKAWIDREKNKVL